MGYMGSVRMKEALPLWIDFYSGRKFDESIKEEILRMSPRTIERFLVEAKADLRRRQNTTTKGGIKKLITEIPVRDLEMKPVEPGHCEVDTVAHCGNSISGSFVYTVTLTDILTGWTECRAIWTKDSVGVRNVLREMEASLPFKIRSFYFDNGSEFMNQKIIEYASCGRKDNPIHIYRGRPYKKNDQCHVEQKNYTNVRSLFGYGRIDDRRAINVMNEIYRGDWSTIQNLFYPQQKLLSKTRMGSKITRKMDKPTTPFSKLTHFLDKKTCAVLETRMKSCNPIVSMSKLRRAVRDIYHFFHGKITFKEWGKTVL